jgi:hypothetical protein
MATKAPSHQETHLMYWIYRFILVPWWQIHDFSIKKDRRSAGPFSGPKAVDES